VAAFGFENGIFHVDLPSDYKSATRSQKVELRSLETESGASANPWPWTHG